MLKELIQEMQRKNLRPKEEISIDAVLETISNNFVANIDLLKSYYKIETGDEINIDSLKSIFKKSTANTYGNTSAPFINDFGRVSENMVPYGIVGLQVERKITLYNYLEIIKVCLETRNSLIIKPVISSKTLETVILLINDVLKQTVDFNEIALTSTDVNLGEEDVDLVVYVGKKTSFKDFSCKSEKLFLGIGQYELLIDEALDVKLIDYAKSNGVEIYFNAENVIDEINENGANYSTAIMSGNKEVIRECITKIKSSYILVNMSPTLIGTANIFPEMLLKRKTTIIYQ